MVSYYLAPSLEVLRSEINQRWPRRDKASDGWIGDTAHQATRSDHNPNTRGSVNAIDVDDDGIDFPTIFAAIKRHPSARYVIYERRLYHRLRGWKAEPYYGSNPHDHHFHLSIDQTRTAEQDRRPWGLLEDDMPLTDADQPIIKAAVHSTQIGRSGVTFGQVLDALRLLPAQVQGLRNEVAAVTGRDPVDEQAIVQGVLAGLDPAAIAAAIPPALAKQVADELAARLAE